MGRMHWSRPAARRTLAALRRLGGVGTTRQIYELTGSMAVHTDIASLRTYLREEMGLEQGVRTEFVERNRSGRMIYKYVLSPDAMFAQTALF